MAIAFDAFSSVAAGTTQRAWTHTPVGTVKGIIVQVAQNVGQTNEVTSVTYGTVTLAAVAVSPQAVGTESGAVYTYCYCGAGIPAGAQTVTVNVTATGSSKIAACITLTADAGYECLLVDSKAVPSTPSTSATDPSNTLSLASLTSFAAIVFHSGANAVSGITPLANWTSRLENDWGNQTCGFYTYNTIGATDVTAGWSQTTEEAAGIAVAMTQRVAAPSPTQATLTLAGTLPSVALALGLGAGSLAFAGLAPTVVEQAPYPNTTISVPAGSLVFKGPARNGSVTAAPAAGALAFTGLAPRVGIDYVITPAAGAVTVTGQTPTVVEAHLAQPAAGGLSLVGPAPEAARTYLASPLAGALVLTGQAPQTLLAYTTSPDVGPLTLTGPAPSATQTLNARPDVGALSLSGLAPSVLEAHLASPAAGSLALTGVAPSTGGTVTVAPDVGVVAIAGPLPTLARTFVATPTVGPVTLGGLAPDLQRTYLIAPAAGTLTLAGDAPTVQQTLLASPGANALTLTGLAPSAIQAHRAIPATGSLSLTGYAPRGASNYHSILVGTGTGYTDVSPKQVVRTSAGVVYLVATNCDSYPCTAATQTVRVYKGDSVPLATTFTRKDAAHEPSDTGTVGVALDGADVLHIVWQNRNGASATRIRHATFDPATDLWGTAEDVDGNVGAAEDVGQGDQFCAVAVDADGVPHVAYLSHDGTHRRLTYRHRTGGTWSAPTVIDDASFGTNEKVWHPNLAFDSHGRIVFAWAIGDFNGNSTGRILVRVLETDGTTLGTTQVLDAGTAKVGIDQSTTLLCADGRIHTAWILGGSAGDDSDEYIRYASAPEALTPSFSTNHPTTWDSHNPSLGLGDTAGTIRIYAHGGANPNDDNLYYVQGPGGAGAWGTRTLYATGTFDASVSTRWATYFHWEPGYLDLAYWDQDYANDLYYGTELAYASRQPTTGGLTLAGLAPTVSVSVNAAATPATGGLTLTGLAPSVRLTYLTSPAAGGLTLGGLAPSTAGTVTVAPSAGGLTLTGPAPTLGRTYLASPGGGALSLTGLPPQTFATILAQPAAGGLTLTGTLPTLGRTYQAALPTGTLTLAGQAPSLAVRFAIPSGTLSLAGLAPAATGTDHLLVTVSAGPLTLTGSAPTLGRTFMTAPTAGVVSLTGLAPTVGVNVGVPVPVGTLTIGGTSPAFAYGLGIPVGTLEFTGTTPELAMGLLEVPAGGLTFVGLAPDVGIQPLPAILYLTVGGSGTLILSGGGSGTVTLAGGGAGTIRLTGGAGDVG